MQHTGGRPPRPPNGGFWENGMLHRPNPGGRKHDRFTRNDKPPWSSTAPQPLMAVQLGGASPNFRRFPAPHRGNQGFQNAADPGCPSEGTSKREGYAGTARNRQRKNLRPYPVPQFPLLNYPPRVRHHQNPPAHPPNVNSPGPRSRPSVPDPKKPTATKSAPAIKGQFTPSLPEISLDNSLPTFDLQAEDVVMQCLLSPQGRKDVDRVVADLKNLLQFVIPDNYPILYGSMATGLALETSDIDCYIGSASIPDGAERMKILLKNYRILSRKQTFCELLSIPKARVPLVKAVHSKTGIEIDISCTSQAAMYNSNFVKFLVGTDDRIRPLIILISICYRLNGLNGTNRFVSYTLVLLVIFYLQNLEIPLLPPLNRLVYKLEGDQWPLGFSVDILSHLPTPNNSDLAELFLGFFKFYNSFQFGQNVASTFMGHAIPVESFSTPDMLPDELSTLKQFYTEDPLQRNNFLNKLICVQDPMEHHLNTTSAIRAKKLRHFQKVNSYMVEMMESNPETSWLEKMLKMTEFIPVADLRNDTPTPNPDLFFSISFPNDELSEEEWLLKLHKRLQDVFRLLLFEVVEVNKEPEAKVRITDGPVHNRSVMTFELQSSYNVFTKRFRGLPKMVTSDPRTFKSAEKEILTISQNMKKPESSFHCELTIKQPVSPQEIPVMIRDINKNDANTYHHLSGLLRENLTKLLEAAKLSEILGDGAKEQGATLIDQKRKPGTKFSISYKRGNNESDDDWKSRLRVDLISLFDFLLLEHSDISSTCEVADSVCADDETILFGFQLKGPYNLFTKRFNNSVLQVLDNPSCIPTVASTNLEKAKSVNMSAVGTLHCELLLVHSDCLSPHQIFVAMYDINQNPRNIFNHYASMLLMNFGGLLNAFKIHREARKED